MVSHHWHSHQFTRSKSDVCVYYQGDREHKIIILLYVDDIIIASKQDVLLDKAVSDLCAHFKMESETLHYYIGMEVHVDVGVSARLTQENYIKRICKRAMVTVNASIKTPMSTVCKLTKDMSPGEGEMKNEEFVSTYRSHVSSIMYAAIQSRPDVTYPTNLAARFMSNPGMKHEEAVQRIFQYLHNTADKSIVYTKQSDELMTNKLVCYVDTSHADSDDLRTTCGYIVYLNGGPISWRTLLHPGSCQSPTQSEYVGMFYAVSEVLSLRNQMDELGYGDSEPTFVHEDNEGSIKIANNPRCHHRLKHIELKYHLTRDAIEDKTIVVVKIPTSDQTADVMTKPLMKKDHWRHTNKLLK